MTTSTTLPPAAPHVVAAAVESLTSRLRKKLDAAVEQYAALDRVPDGTDLVIACGPDAVVTLAPGPSGTITDESQARCTCLLSPRCLHRAALLTACPLPGLGDTPQDPTTPSAAPLPEAASPEATQGVAASGVAPRAGQVEAAAGLWRAAAAVLVAGVPGAGAVPQAELLRAAHTARLAGLPKAEAATLRLVRGLRAARERHDGHRLADLVSSFRDLLLTVARLAASDPDPALIGTVRRPYRPNGGLKVHGVFREPVISATGYGGVVTHLVTEDGRWFSVADVRPGGAARARGAATATVAIGNAMMSHAQLSRGGLLIAGATVSPDGRLGAGKGVRATPVPGLAWTDGPLAELFARPLAEAAGTRLAAEAWSEEDSADQAKEPVGCDLMIVGTSGDHVLARELLPAAVPQAAPGDDVAGRGLGVLVRLVPASRHPALAYVENLRRLGARPGLCVRVVARVESGRAATLSPLAAGPVAGTEATLRLPDEWHGRADLGYDRLQGANLPDACPEPEPYDEVDPLAGAPLWRVRRLVELAVSGGRRAVAESGRGGDAVRQAAHLRQAGFRTAATLAVALTEEADRRDRDVFGRLTDTDPDRYARAWLATATHLAATERALVRTSWHPAPTPQDG